MPSAQTAPPPMLATLGDVPTGSGWAFEWKWDGQRAIAVVRSGECRLFSRNGNEATNSFPELAEVLSGALRGREGIVDGEVVALDEKGRPSFSRPQRGMHVQRPTAQIRAAAPVSFFAFDVLEVDGQSTTGLPCLERRAMLTDLVTPGPRVQVPPHQTDVDGRKMLDLAREHGLEGVVAKRVDSTYRPGRRSPAWVKTPLRNNTEAIVIGWVDGTGTARDGVGSLLLGTYDDDHRLVYIGHVGTGFTTAGRRALRQQLARIERPTRHPTRSTCRASTEPH
ncbi:ATP-dependent DNA ligase [Rhodococcus ruber]|uniref:ATP-dependent DNA ligase n=1 Tax=Rhodococcus ruber TaxID=1830 RepID=UPI0009E4DDD2|nr:RNA ligase family protein [Rhodococcus ruber]